MKYSYKTEQGEIRIIDVLEGGPQAFIPENATLIGHIYTELPDNYFREIWIEENGQIKVDIQQAREFKLNKIREERAKYLIDSDREFAEEMSKVYADIGHQDKTKISEIASIPSVKAVLDKKKLLRDIPQVHRDLLNALENLDEIKNYKVNFS